ncbi:DUF2846 domain-containing protein [Pedobacter sp. MC2016-05]|uniref:DUF2846 domain-containing protein n=1 Tax=Pedobacter sp. MC2016-05 TaxID=2994474 RepID=UPI00224702E2|nr:DUF2846 domain-containing protein [Pedobacter sp. MC2016-05]MCX2473781.1 DUF2846 domain-containing protein [Pedobacter sp. MC2016-05]
MKRLKLISFLLFLFAISSASFAQDKTGKIYVIRRTGINGSAVNFRIFVDGELICKMKNKTYSLHDLKLGEHTITVTSGGLPDSRNKVPVKFIVVDGKTNYFMINSGNELTCMEIMQSTAEPMIARSVEVRDCLGSK